MTKNIIYLLIFISFGCGSIRGKIFVFNDGEFDLNGSEFNGNTYIDTTHFFYEGIEAINTYAYNYEGKKTTMLIDKQIVFFENGQRKQIGNYKIGSYINCCMAGPCMTYYPYKTGRWQYFYNNGQLMASGTYVNDLEHIDTSCEGGDEHFTNRISDDWKYYDEKGNLIEPTSELIKELEFLEVFYNYL